MGDLAMTCREYNECMVSKCRNVLKNTLFLELTMVIPQKMVIDIWLSIENLLAEQFSTHFDI